MRKKPKSRREPSGDEKFAGGVIVAILMFTGMFCSGPDDDTGDPPGAGYSSRASSYDAEPDVDPETVRIARECVAGGYGTPDECVVGAVIVNGG